MEQALTLFAEYVALGLEAVAILVIALGGAEAAYRSFWPLLRGRLTHATRRSAWLSLARWLLLGLEFMLAADIVRTVISPDWQDIAALAAIALIRTFLNYFLERDLEAASSLGEST